MKYLGYSGCDRALSLCLYLGALSFPFSVAAANLFFAGAIMVALFSRKLWQGFQMMWQHYTTLSVIALLYFILMVIGLAWSQDVEYGLRVLSYQWIWLIVPVFLAVMTYERQCAFLSLLSLSLMLHLCFCIAQMQGWIHFETGGSNQQDATGFIGHIAFGVVYGIWASLLIFWGYRQQGWYRWVSWLFAVWAVAMVFAAQGRSAYLVVIIVLVVMFYRIAMEQQKKKHLMVALLILVSICIGIVLGPGKNRVVATWDGVVAAWEGHLADAQPRWRLWVGSFEIMKTAPWYGVGTGGYPHAVAILQQARPDLEPHLGTGSVLAHPHNTYIQNLVRWGVTGSILSLLFFIVWIRTGWVDVWQQHPSHSMIAISGVAMLVHGLSAPAMEEHFPAMMAAMILGVGLGMHAFRSGELSVKQAN